MAGGGGRLSGLPDDLFRRILSFASAKEGASTAVLSRRWRSLWRTSAAVTIDSRSYPFMTPGDNEAALAAAAEGPVIRKLTLRVEEHIIGTNLRIRSYSGHESKSMLAAFLSGLAAAAAGAGLEELRVVVTDGRHDYGNQAEFNFDDLPSPESLRVLHVFNCSTMTVPPPAAAFSLPRLTELRLQRCGVSLINLQRIVEAAPQLATLHLECYYYVSTCGILDGSQIGVEGPRYRIHCPAVTVLVFEACSPLWPWKEGGLELDVPKLQYFRYKGLVHLQNRLSLKLSASSANVIRTDLHFVQQKYMGEQDRVRFWEFVQSFNATKVMKMKVDFSADQVAMDEKGELLGNRLFYNLERLDLEVACEPATASKTCALFLASLLRCCPVVRGLHIKLNSKASSRTNPTEIIQARSEFDKSIDHFRHHRQSPEIMLNDGDEDENYMVSDIPGLSDRSFDCLKSCLRTVSLQFWMQEQNCFGVQLAKFFAENAVVLEEISIDDGNHKLRDHVNRMLRRWVSGSSKRKNSTTTTAFRESYTRKRKRN